jgi:hypothetical protein
VIRTRFLLAAALLAGAAPIAAAGCGERVLLGGSQPGTSPACNKAACGAPCTIEACMHGSACDTPDVMGFCASDGSCVPEAPDCPPPPPPPCADQPCGTPCDATCSPNDPDCMMPGAGSHECDGKGACVPGPLMCPCMGPDCPPPYEPCLGKPCGAPCDMCPPGDPMCMEPPGPKSCDHFGACVMGMSTCTPTDAGLFDGGP